MKVICDRGALVESLNLVSGVIVARTPKPVLACVKLTATEDSLTLAGTDLEVAIRLTTPRVEVQEPGDALVPADKLQQIVRESTDPTLTIETEQDVARITGQDSRFKVFGQPPADFPAIPEFKGEADFVISAADLHRLIAMTIFATARENSRYAINGVLMEREGNKLAMIATDGHRLALARGSCQAANDQARSAIVPTKALNLLLRLFDDAEQTVKIKVNDSQILFETDEAMLASNLVEGNFPPYKDVIPKEGDKRATLDTDVFVSAVRRAALLTNEESKGVRMAFSDGGLTLSSRAPEMGEAEISVPVPQYQGDAIEIGFNPSYLLDALKVVDSGQVQFEFKAGNKPGVLRTGPNFLYVIMPVNLQ
ncbi:MAG: DNA polymerase III subunit beta [Phycisphaeraceae bacterium]